VTLGFSVLLVHTGCQFVSASSTLSKAPVLIGRRVYQGSLNGHAGLLFFAANDSLMTVVYDTVRGGLYMAWKGPVLGPKRDSKGEYAPQGPLYQFREEAHFWTVIVGADTVIPTVKLLGIEEDTTGYLVFHFSLNLPGGRSIKVDESPLHDDHYGDHALLRTFNFEGLDSVTSARLRLGSPHLTWDETWSLSVAGNLERKIGTEALIMNRDDKSQIKVTWIGSRGGTEAVGRAEAVGTTEVAGKTEDTGILE
jgi:hypothetical protein